MRVLEGLYDDQASVPRIVSVMEYALQFKDTINPYNIIIIKSIVQFLRSFCYEIKVNFSLGAKMIAYCLEIMDSPELLPVAADLFSEASRQLQNNVSLDDFTMLAQKTFMMCQKSVSESPVEDLVTGLWNLTDCQGESETIKAQRQKILEFVHSKLGEFCSSASIQSTADIHLTKLLRMLLSTFRALDSICQVGDETTISRHPLKRYICHQHCSSISQVGKDVPQSV